MKTETKISITSSLDLPVVKKIISLITLTCFTILILWTSGYSAVIEQIEEKNKQQPQVYQRWATVQEQIQHKKLTEVFDKQTNQIYRFDKSGKLVEIEDRNTGEIKKFEYDSKGNAKLKNVKKQSDKKEKGKEIESEEKEEDSSVSSDEELQQNKLKVSSWLNEYLSADPQKKQQMISEVGITKEDVEEMSEQTQKKILEYVLVSSTKKLVEGNVTTKNLSKKLGEILDKTRSGLVRFFIEVVKKVGLTKSKEKSSEVQISIEEIQKIAKEYGIELNATNTDISGLNQILRENPAIVYTKENNSGVFLIITDFQGEKVVGVDSYGERRVLLSVSEFISKWDGKVLSLSNIGEVLDNDTKRNTKGTFFTKLLGEIKNIFLQQKPQQQITTQTQKQNAQLVTNLISSFLNEYINADPGKKAQLVSQFGLSVDQLTNLSSETAQKIIDYLKSQGDKIFNCAIQSLMQILKSQGSGVDINSLTFQTIMIDILTGVLTPGSASMGSQLQLSMFAMQQAAKLNGIDLTGYQTTLEGLIHILQNGGQVVARLDLGNGIGHFVTVNKIENGLVYYIDSDGNLKSLSIKEWNKLWDGNILTNKDISGISGTTKLTDSKMQSLVGAEGRWVWANGGSDPGWEVWLAARQYALQKTGNANDSAAQIEYMIEHGYLIRLDYRKEFEKIMSAGDINKIDLGKAARAYAGMMCGDPNNSYWQRQFYVEYFGDPKTGVLTSSTWIGLLSITGAKNDTIAQQLSQQGFLTYNDIMDWINKNFVGLQKNDLINLLNKLYKISLNIADDMKNKLQITDIEIKFKYNNNNNGNFDFIVQGNKDGSTFAYYSSLDIFVHSSEQK